MKIIMTKRTLLKAFLLQSAALVACVAKPAKATEKVAHYENIPASGDNNGFSGNAQFGADGPTFEVYRKGEIDDLITATKTPINNSLTKLTNEKASKTELDAAKGEITETFKQAVQDSLGMEQAKAIRAQVRAELKADAGFRQEIKAEVMQDLLADSAFITQVAAKVTPHP